MKNSSATFFGIFGAWGKIVSSVLASKRISVNCAVVSLRGFQYNAIPLPPFTIRLNFMLNLIHTFLGV